MFYRFKFKGALAAERRRLLSLKKWVRVIDISSPRATNAVLNCLSPEALHLLEPFLEDVDLPVRMQLERPHQFIKYVYFPISGFASIVANGVGAAIEVGMVGREGMTGLDVVLGANQSPNETYIQSAGKGKRISSENLREKIEECLSLRDCLLLFCRLYLIQVSQTCLANGRGKIEERLARWLLMAHDRAIGDKLNVTHEFLGIMLGVRRPGVTIALNELQSKGLIKTTRGLIQIIDRDTLEGLSNGLYGVAEAEFEKMLTQNNNC